jgi:hypothetical protein
MQSITLSFSHRIIVWNMVGNYNAPSLKEASIFLRIIEKIRLSDTEQQETEFRTVGGQYLWRLPSPEYGGKTVALEIDETRSLAAALESSPIRVADAEWLQKLVDDLKPSLNGA